MPFMNGQLYVIATPIGNLGDITLRALEILKEKADILYCEDTRQTRKLIAHYGISLPLRSFHAHSGEGPIAEALRFLMDGKSIAYATDSGTPGLSDPGARLVSEARRNGITIIPIPGPSALTSMISVCGFPEKNIIFAGFLSKKQGRRRTELQRLSAFPGVIVLFESPYRIKKTLEDIALQFPDCAMLIGREMTKIYEEFIANSASEIVSRLENLKEKGEFTLAIFNKKH